MVRFIDQEDGSALIEVCARDKGYTCGIIRPDGGVHFFKRYFLERETSKLFPSELIQIAEKGVELAKAFKERPDDPNDYWENDSWEEIFSGG